ncbi:DUF2628 domain-containing protein [Chelativorans sp. SCAU2101]|uniref:DUF2628 domain-containing protein n=1 Tax=Chelativorans petroleitrophicus TaxID=2975484 RepID=A0A9X3B5S0_9HYPH|nr:DUF2628 domain-containing protein [Chelativorans petroleitrophicus]MCT8989152.1 DUF2628 domain-containing protein [Chelativorans petroleitrophicus]
MTSYLVMEPPRAGPVKAEEALIIRDGFSLTAFLFPLIWFLWHRMWLEALAFLALVLVIGAVGSFTEGDIFTPIVSVLLAILIGLEAPALRAAALRRRGWTDWGVVEGANHAEAELRYAAEAGEEAPAAQPSAVPPAFSAGRPVSPGSMRTRGLAFGLIDYPRRG